MVKKALLCVTLVLSVLLGTSFAWKNTPELKKEIMEKEGAVKSSPKSPDAYFDMAITYAYTNKIESGLSALKKTADLCGDVKGYSKVLIMRYYPAVQKNPDDYKLRFRLAFSYYFGGYKKYAKDELKNVTVVAPKNPWAWGYMAIISVEDYFWSDALYQMKKSIYIDSNVAAFHLGLAQAYSKTGNNFGAVLETSEALRLRAMGF